MKTIHYLDCTKHSSTNLMKLLSTTVGYFKLKFLDENSKVIDMIVHVVGHESNDIIEIKSAIPGDNDTTYKFSYDQDNKAFMLVDGLLIPEIIITLDYELPFQDEDLDLIALN